MKLILRNQIVKSVRGQSFKSQSSSRLVVSFALAGAIAGVNYYFQNYIANEENQRQNQLIERVSNEQTAEDFLRSFDYHQSNDWQCKKITIDGTLKDGRFLVKRNRGNEQGYLVLAPFTIEKDKALSTKRKVQRKFILNLGWIPKHSKHLVKTLTAADIIGENQYTAENRIEAIEKQRKDKLLRDPLELASMSTITTVEAYVRRGEERDILNGLNNWRDQRFYKFIDLNWLTTLFRITNTAEAQTVYLERVAKSEEELEVVPIPSTKQNIIEDLKERIELNNKTKDRNVWMGTAGSLVGGLLLALI